ncbi:MAG: hypothetical protein QOJ29_2742, partial [Thermoleophilaceae bacterium]|nr:hypothetical protein [Thermoleophilaceae bacterium]
MAAASTVALGDDGQRRALASGRSVVTPSLRGRIGSDP